MKEPDRHGIAESRDESGNIIKHFSNPLEPPRPFDEFIDILDDMSQIAGLKLSGFARG
jgi:hypothetical protein